MLLAGYGAGAARGGDDASGSLTYLVYRRNAYKVFPALRIRPSLFRRARLREVTGFSVYVVDHRLGQQAQLLRSTQIVIGVFLGAARGRGLDACRSGSAETLQRLTNQFNGVLFPVVVDSDAAQQAGAAAAILHRGHAAVAGDRAAASPRRCSLLADPLIRAWVGPEVRREHRRSSRS